MWVWNEDTSSMVQREITFVPGLYKIFDEILGNTSFEKHLASTYRDILAVV